MEFAIEEVKNNKELNIEISKELKKYKNQNLVTKSEIGEIMLVKSIAQGKIINDLGDIIADMDIENEEIKNKYNYSLKQIGKKDDEIIREMTEKKIVLCGSEDRIERIRKRFLEHKILNEKWEQNH